MARRPARATIVLVPIADRDAADGFEKEHAVFNKIIVGVDGREGGRDALALAARLASLFGGELVAVHAYPYDLFISRGATPRSREHHARQRRGPARWASSSAPTSSRTPPPCPTARPAARCTWPPSATTADLIVVGSAHRGAIGRVLAGDVTMGTLHGAECPVVVAPRGFADRGATLQTIGVGFDGSPESRAAVELARDARGRRRRAAEGASASWSRRARAGPRSATTPTGRSAPRSAATRPRQSSTPMLAELGDIATGEVVVGDPATELAYAGNDLDLLVTGSRGYGPGAPAHARQHVDQARARGAVPRARAHARRRGGHRARRRQRRHGRRGPTTP